MISFELKKKNQKKNELDKLAYGKLSAKLRSLNIN